MRQSFEAPGKNGEPLFIEVIVGMGTARDLRNWLLEAAYAAKSNSHTAIALLFTCMSWHLMGLNRLARYWVSMLMASSWTISRSKLQPSRPACPSHLQRKLFSSFYCIVGCVECPQSARPTWRNKAGPVLLRWQRPSRRLTMKCSARVTGGFRSRASPQVPGASG